MKQIGLFAIGLALSSFTFGQTVTIQAGPSFSSIKWREGNSTTDWLDKKLVGYAFFIGLDYLDKPHFNLSSNLGMIRKGGKGEVVHTDANGVPTHTSIEKPTLDYISANTTADLKYKTGSLTPFVSIGPRVDFLVSKSNHFDAVESRGDLKNIAAGLILGGGIKYNIQTFELGLRANYYLEFMKVAEWPGAVVGEIKTQTFAVNMSVGYKL